MLKTLMLNSIQQESLTSLLKLHLRISFISLSFNLTIEERILTLDKEPYSVSSTNPSRNGGASCCVEGNRLTMLDWVKWVDEDGEDTGTGESFPLCHQGVYDSRWGHMRMRGNVWDW